MLTSILKILFLATIIGFVLGFSSVKFKVEGDPNKIKTVIDHWKFTRKISSLNPNWYLADIKNS